MRSNMVLAITVGLLFALSNVLLVLNFIPLGPRVLSRSPKPTTARSPMPRDEHRCQFLQSSSSETNAVESVPAQESYKEAIGRQELVEFLWACSSARNQPPSHHSDHEGMTPASSMATVSLNGLFDDPADQYRHAPSSHGSESSESYEPPPTPRSTATDDDQFDNLSLASERPGPETNRVNRPSNFSSSYHGRSMRFTEVVRPLRFPSPPAPVNPPANRSVVRSRMNPPVRYGFSRSTTNAFPATLYGFPVEQNYDIPRWSRPDAYVSTVNIPNVHDWGVRDENMYKMKASSMHELRANVKYERPRICVKITITDRHFEFTMDDTSVMESQLENVINAIHTVKAAPNIIVASRIMLPDVDAFEAVHTWKKFFVDVEKLEVIGKFKNFTLYDLALAVKLAHNNRLRVRRRQWKDVM